MNLEGLNANSTEYRPGDWEVTCNNGERNRHVKVNADCWQEASFLAPLQAGGEYQQWEVTGAKTIPPIQEAPAGWAEQWEEENA